MTRIVSFLFFALMATQLIAQIGTTTEGFKIKLAAFTPPTQDMVSNFEGNQATPFMANDHNQKEIFLGDLKGQAVLLWFMDPVNGESVSQFYDLNTLVSEFKGKPVRVIGFFKGNRSEMNEFLASHPTDFSMIPNAGILGEGPYAGELGYPRMFFINRSGVIDKVLPSEAFTPDLDTKGFAHAIFSYLMKG